MIFRKFETLIHPLPTFNLNDIKKIDSTFHRTQLNDWISRGFIKRFAGGYYIFTSTHIDEPLLYMLANMIYEPSYISRESALAYYNVIPESVLGVTSISSRKTKHFDTQWGILNYRSIKSNLMFGYKVIEKSPIIKYKIATMEKAILDYLYWNPDIKSEKDLEGLRWNQDLILDLKDNPLFLKYLKIFNCKALNKKFMLLMEYAHA